MNSRTAPAAATTAPASMGCPTSVADVSSGHSMGAVHAFGRAAHPASTAMHPAATALPLIDAPRSFTQQPQRPIRALRGCPQLALYWRAGPQEDPPSSPLTPLLDFARGKIAQVDPAAVHAFRNQCGGHLDRQVLEEGRRGIARNEAHHRHGRQRINHIGRPGQEIHRGRGATARMIVDESDHPDLRGEMIRILNMGWHGAASVTATNRLRHTPGQGVPPTCDVDGRAVLRRQPRDGPQRRGVAHPSPWTLEERVRHIPHQVDGNGVVSRRHLDRWNLRPRPARHLRGRVGGGSWHRGRAPHQEPQQ